MPCFVVFFKVETASPVVYNLEKFLNGARAHCTEEGLERVDSVLESYDFENGRDGEPLVELQDIISGYFFIKTGLPLSTPLNVSFHSCNTALQALAEAKEEWEQEFAALEIAQDSPMPIKH